MKKSSSESEMQINFTLVVAIAAVLVLIYPAPAQAYLDPLTGSLFFQAVSFILVSILTGFYFIGNKIRRFFSWIKTIVTGLSKNKS